MNLTIIRFFQWLRWPNLLIVIVTLAFIRYGLIAPNLHKEGLPLAMGTLSFVMLTVLTLLITFGGYVINDIYDQATDARNKPDKKAIGVWMTETRAKSLYLVLVFMGAFLTLYLAWKEEKLQWAWIYPLVVYLLWVYSSRLKGTVLWGNLLVSFLCAAVALLIPFAEKEALLQLAEGRQLMFTLYFYAAFAGISNLLREIIKDAQDQEGDSISGLNTLAVVHGTGASKIAAILVGLLLFSVLLVFFLMDDRPWPKIVGFASVTLPLLGMVFFGLFHKEKNIDWKKLSRLTKLLMVAGLIGLLILL